MKVTSCSILKCAAQPVQEKTTPAIVSRKRKQSKVIWLIVMCVVLSSVCEMYMYIHVYVILQCRSLPQRRKGQLKRVSLWKYIVPL